MVTFEAFYKVFEDRGWVDGELTEERLLEVFETLSSEQAREVMEEPGRIWEYAEAG